MTDAPSPSVAQFYLDGDPHLTPERLIAHTCETRGVDCAAILGISDELYEPWRIGFGPPELREAIARAGRAGRRRGARDNATPN